MKTQKTIAVIGAGVSGLSAGAALAKRGHKVKIFEANSFVGGCCSTVDVDGYTFNNGAMAVIMPAMLDFVFRKLGVERESVLPLRKIVAPQVSIIGEEVVTIHAGGEITFDRAKQAEAEACNDVARLLGRWGEVNQILQEELFLRSFSVGRLVSRLAKHLPKFSGTVTNELARLIRNENLRAALLGLLSYSGEPPEKLPNATVVAIVSALMDGYYLPEKSMSQIADALAGVLRSYGGEIELNARVKRIHVRGRRGLELARGEFFEADEIISSASGMLTYGTLLAREDAPASMRRKAETARLSMRGFTVQVGTRAKVATDNFLSYVIPPLGETDDYYASNGSGKYGMFGVPTVTLPELAPAGTSVLEMASTFNTKMPLSAWTDEETERVSNATLEMTKRYVDFDIAVKRVRSPKQFQEELNLYEGAIYGISPLAGVFGYFPQKTSVPGLYLVGQTTLPGFGVTPAAVSGVLLAERYF